MENKGIKKIVVIGPESTGKSTLCEQLAQFYEMQWCPEFAREYLITNGKEYDHDELLTIAKGQIALEDEYAAMVKNEWSINSENIYVHKNSQRAIDHQPLLFIDTDMYVMKVWDEYVFGKCHQFILDEIVNRKYDLYLLCDIDYQQQGNIYTNLTRDLNTVTGTVCIENDAFQFMEAPPGSLMNADANYMIACIQPNTHYNVSIQVPQIMCSLGYNIESEHPWINEQYDLRYASLSIISTTAPRPTIETYIIPCDIFVYTIEIYVTDDVPFPGLLYRQLLPNPSFEESIEYAKKKCYDYVNSVYDIYCIQLLMGSYYPQLFPA